MRKLTYLAVLEPSNDGFDIYFLDLPGCISFGKDIEEAQLMASEALKLHVYGMEKDGDPLPVPSKILSKVDIEAGIIEAITILPDMEKSEI